MPQTVGFRLAFWHLAQHMRHRWLDHLVLVTAGWCSGISLRAFWEAAWRLLEPPESTYVPSQKTSGHESSPSHQSVAPLGLPTDPSSHEWLFSTVPSFLSFCLTSPLIQMPHHTPSPRVVPAHWYHLSTCHLATPNAICGWANIWLNVSHSKSGITSCCFNIWALLNSHGFWDNRSSWPNIPLHGRRAQAGAVTEAQWKAAQLKQTRSSGSDCALHSSLCTAGYVNKPLDMEERHPSTIRRGDRPIICVPAWTRMKEKEHISMRWNWVIPVLSV